MACSSGYGLHLNVASTFLLIETYIVFLIALLPFWTLFISLSFQLLTFHNICAD